MYNRYISGGEFQDFFSPIEGANPVEPKVDTQPQTEPSFVDVSDDNQAEQQGERETSQEKKVGGLKGLFGNNIKLPDFDADTILLLVLVYFLVADGGESQNGGEGKISDTLLIIGVLLLLGF